jgi:hypothetical protein
LRKERKKEKEKRDKRLRNKPLFSYLEREDSADKAPEGKLQGGVIEDIVAEAHGKERNSGRDGKEIEYLELGTPLTEVTMQQGID